MRHFDLGIRGAKDPDFLGIHAAKWIQIAFTEAAKEGNSYFQSSELLLTGE